MKRLDAELSETDDEGRPLTSGKVAGISGVGNQDGAHHVSAELARRSPDAALLSASPCPAG